MIVAANPDRIVCVHKGGKAGRRTRGAVTRGDKTLGYAVQRSRVAAGTRGARATFFTATPAPCAYSPASGGLGTRYPTRRDAVRALVAFANFCETGGVDPSTPLAARSRAAVGAFYSALDEFNKTYDRGF